MRLAGVLVGAAALLGGCKVSQLKKNEVPSSGTAQALQPKLLADSDPSAAAISVDFDDKAHRPKGTIVLRLDYVPESSPSTATLPACLQPLPGSFELGSVACSDGSTERMPLIAANVDQQCFSKADAPKQTTAQPLQIAGCRRAALTMHQFDPPLKISVP